MCNQGFRGIDYDYLSGEWIVLAGMESGCLHNQKPEITLGGSLEHGNIGRLAPCILQGKCRDVHGVGDI